MELEIQSYHCAARLLALSSVWSQDKTWGCYIDGSRACPGKQRVYDIAVKHSGKIILILGLPEYGYHCTSNAFWSVE